MVGEKVDRREEGFAAFAVRLDIIDHPLHDEMRRIIILGQGRGLAIFGPRGAVVHALDRALFEIVGAGVGEAVGAVVAARVRQTFRIAAEVPFAGEIGAIARRLQELRDRHNAQVHHRVVTGLAAMFVGDRLGHVAESVAVVHHPRLQHRARRRARPRDMEVRETHPRFCQCVDVRRRDFGAKRTDVRKAPVVGEQDHDIGVLWRRWSALRLRGRYRDQGADNDDGSTPGPA